jgi:hypothetical protein
MKRSMPKSSLKEDRMILWKTMKVLDRIHRPQNKNVNLIISVGEDLGYRDDGEEAWNR